MTTKNFWYEMLSVLEKLDCVIDFQKCLKNECWLHAIESDECLRDWHMEYLRKNPILPKTASEVAKMFNVGLRIVQRWCEQNGVSFTGEGRRKIWTLYPDDIERFKNRRGPGRPYP